MDKRLIRFFKQQFRHGRSTAAHMVDKITSTAGVLIIAFIIIWSMGASVRWSIVFAVCAAVAFIIISNGIYKKKLSKYIARIKKEAEKELAFEKLIIEENAIRRIIEKLSYEDGGGKLIGDVFITPAGMYFIKLYHPLCEFTANDALAAIKKYNSSGARRLTVITTAKISEGAVYTINRWGGSFDEDIIKCIVSDYTPDDKAVEEYLISKYEEHMISREKLRQDFTDRNKAGNWAACAVMLVVWGIIFGKGALYFTAAGICGALSGYCMLAKRNSDESGKNPF